MVSSTPPGAAGFEPDAVWCLRRPRCRLSGTQERPTVVVRRSAAASLRLYGRFRAGRTVRAHPAGFRARRGSAESSSPPFAATRAAAVADRLPFASSRLGRDARRRCAGARPASGSLTPPAGRFAAAADVPDVTATAAEGVTAEQACRQAIRRCDNPPRRRAARTSLSAPFGGLHQFRALLGDQPTRSIGDSAGLPAPGRGAGLCFAGEGVEAAPVELPATGESCGGAAARRPAPRAFCAAPTTSCWASADGCGVPPSRGRRCSATTAERRRDSPPDGCLSGRGRPRSPRPAIRSKNRPPPFSRRSRRGGLRHSILKSAAGLQTPET